VKEREIINFKNFKSVRDLWHCSIMKMKERKNIKKKRIEKNDENRLAKFGMMNFCSQHLK
jgi:hypothetical protein